MNASNSSGPVDLAGLITIDLAGEHPPFEQIRLAVIELVATGALLTGSRIPTVRALAEAVHLAPNTVARSYRELEAAGVIETRGRQGSFIKAGPDTQTAAAARRTVEHVRTLRDLGVDDETIAELLRRALEGH